MLAIAGCDSGPLFAPSESTVTLTTGASFVPNGGTAEVTAFVAESSGTPVHNGTSVRFSTNLGRVEPVEAQTRNGYAVATFVAGEASGVAEVRAMSGAIGGGSGAAPGSASNIVQITVGAAGAESVVLGANPSTVPAGGGTVDLLATVTGAGGSSLPGVPVTFSTSAGQLASTVVTTDGAGNARTSLTTDRTATVTAQAGARTSNTVTVTAQAVVVPSLTASESLPVVGSGQNWSFTATVTPTDGVAQPVEYEWNFGDGASATTNSNTTSHVYTSGSGSPRTVTVTIRLSTGERVTASTQILLGVF